MAVSTNAARTGLGSSTGTVVYSTGDLISIPEYNTYFVGAAGNSSATGTQNTGGGKEALLNLSSGGSNTALGYRALRAVTTGANNTGLGHQALLEATGDSNTAVGQAALQSTVGGARNFGGGFQAGFSNTSGVNNVSVGYRAGWSNSGTSYCVAVGADALFNNTVASNTAIGAEAAYSVTTATNTVAVGRRAAYGKTTGNECTYVGLQAGYAGTATVGTNTGEGVTAIGAYAFGYNTTGAYNTGCGRASGWYNTTGTKNSYVGYRSGYGNTSGSDNITLGYYAGHNTSTGSKNTMVGAQTDYYVPNSTSMTATAAAGGSMAVGSYSYRVTFVLDGVETALSETPVTGTTAGANLQIDLASIPTYTGPKTCSARKIYRTKVGGENLLYLVTTISDNTTTTYTDNTADGALGAQPTHSSGSIMLGYGAWAYKAGQMVVGSTSARITEVYIGGGVDDTAPATVSFAASNASGTNTAGASLRISGGKGTGTGKSGSLILSAAAAGGAGSSANALTDWVTLDGNGFLTMKETTSASVATPAAGHINLFVEGGSLKFRNSAGTVLTVTAT